MRPFLDADYSAIEARIVCWLAGQEDALDEYRLQDAATTKEDKERLDRYRIMASVIFGIEVQDVQKFPHRFVGKESILGCGFGLGPVMFRKNCEKKGKFIMAPGLEFTAVEAFRQKHDAVQQYWWDVDRCAKRAILNKGIMIAHRNVAFLYEDVGKVPFLLIRLPSGRKLAYPRARIDNKRIVFYGNIKGNIYGDVDTYGGKLVENITQAVAADIMAYGAHNAEKAGYQIATLIHDQALAYYREGQTGEEFVRLLTTLPKWADGLPIAAEGGLVPFYKKD